MVGWSGALRCQPGIHVVSGTGSVAYGEDGRGGAARAGGWSVYFGDEGSSYWAAVKGINAFFRQADGRMPRTMLFDYFMELFRLSDPLHMPGAFEEATEGGKADRVAAFQRHVSELAKRGDPCALEIYRQAGEALAALVTALKTRLHFPEDETIRVTYSGGLFRNGACVLDPFRAITEAQGCRVETPAYGPLAGAVGYAARDLLSAGALERVMAAADA